MIYIWYQSDKRDILTEVEIMAKEFIYTKVQDLGKIGDKTVEIGHYIVDGKVMPDKVYMVNHFTRKNGSEDSKATAICAIGEAKEIGKLLIEVENK